MAAAIRRSQEEPYLKQIDASLKEAGLPQDSLAAAISAANAYFKSNFQGAVDAATIVKEALDQGFSVAKAYSDRRVKEAELQKFREQRDLHEQELRDAHTRDIIEAPFKNQAVSGWNSASAYGPPHQRSYGNHEGAYLTNFFHAYDEEGNAVMDLFDKAQPTIMVSESRGGFPDSDGPLVRQSDYNHAPSSFIRNTHLALRSNFPNRGPFMSTKLNDPSWEDPLNLYQTNDLSKWRSEPQATIDYGSIEREIGSAIDSVPAYQKGLLPRAYDAIGASMDSALDSMADYIIGDTDDIKEMNYASRTIDVGRPGKFPSYKEIEEFDFLGRYIEAEKSFTASDREKLELLDRARFDAMDRFQESDDAEEREALQVSIDTIVADRNTIAEKLAVRDDALQSYIEFTASNKEELHQFYRDVALMREKVGRLLTTINVQTNPLIAKSFTDWIELYEKKIRSLSAWGVAFDESLLAKPGAMKIVPEMMGEEMPKQFERARKNVAELLSDVRLFENALAGEKTIFKTQSQGEFNDFIGIIESSYGRIEDFDKSENLMIKQFHKQLKGSRIFSPDRTALAAEREANFDIIKSKGSKGDISLEQHNRIREEMSRYNSRAAMLANKGETFAKIFGGDFVTKGVASLVKTTTGKYLYGDLFREFAKQDSFLTSEAMEAYKLTIEELNKGRISRIISFAFEKAEEVKESAFGSRDGVVLGIGTGIEF